MNVDTGKIVWHYQTSPHDTHDWDSAQTPILVDGEFNGKPRKLVLQATRNGLFFVLDRVTGEHLLTTRFAQWGKWIKKFNQNGQPVRDPAKDASRAGSLVNPNGWTNWPPSAYSPQTGLFYLRDLEAYGLLFTSDAGENFVAFDARTGAPLWHSRLHGVSNAPESYALDDRQYVLIAAGDTLYAFDLYE